MISHILEIVFDTDFTEETIVKIIERLENLGFSPKDKDIFNIGFSIQNVDRAIKRKINSLVIPKELLDVAIDIVCGEVLFILKNSNQLGENFDIEQSLKTIQAGDTTVTYSDNFMTEEQRLDYLINYLRKKDEEFIRYRRICW